MAVQTPNMGLQQPTVGTDTGTTWENSINANSSVIDQHNHTSGSGVPIQPAGININTSLPFNNNPATALQAAVFNAQPSLATLKAVYVIGNDLYYNDGASNIIQITSGGAVNASSSGIASGTASAAFSSGVLVVKSSSSSGANTLVQSLVLTNSGNLTNQLTLQAPTLTGSATLTLPPIPGSTSFMQIDTSGNMTAGPAVSQGITNSNIANATITGAKIASATVTKANQVAVGQQTSAPSGSFSTSSSSFVNVATGFTATITIASPAVVTCTASSVAMYNNMIVQFTTTGALPTGLSTNTNYFVVNLTQNIITHVATFNVATVANGTPINTSGTQSGTHTANVCTLSQTITTSGRPVMVIVSGGSISVSQSGGGVGSGNLQIVSGLVIYSVTLGDPGSGISGIVFPASFVCLDTSTVGTPGTYSYYVQAQTSGAGSGEQIQVSNVTLTLYEL